MVPKRKTTPTKKPSKSLVSKINSFNRMNEQANKKLNAARQKILAQAKKEGFAVKQA